MTIKRLTAIAIIIACTALAWFLLASAVNFRSNSSDSQLSQEVAKNWGPALTQEPPRIYYEAPNSTNARRELPLESSKVSVTLDYQPKQKGLLWYRTYNADFAAEYVVKNPTPIPQTIYVSFRFPAADARYDRFSLKFGDKLTDKSPVDGEILESLLLAPGAEQPLTITYRASGMNVWTYSLKNARRVRNLHLSMITNFRDYNIPESSQSPNGKRTTTKDGWKLEWDYTDVLGSNAIAMDMPAVTNPGAVAGRMTFFAPVSLLFFFAVLVIVAIQRRVNLHPMNFFFLAAGCFAFHLLFAYLVDLVPLLPSFLLAAVVSLALVNGYLWRAAGRTFALISAGAQFAYMVLFSYSFFFDGLTGISITAGAIVTLGLLMAFTARVDWSATFAPRTTPPPIPAR